MEVVHVRKSKYTKKYTKEYKAEVVKLMRKIGTTKAAIE